ncbi:flagellar assembly protein T N-terminal domain-containing protein [Neptunicella marina]|uniref:Flagella assembly protein FlgT n=1 Tax=Neptunicella marina TaxID=2125989 RepID=A0A8J6IW51_9ALTE|nr:flagellar assembly protein T N-terminal domain-containing protein [Neptunicella marina]MBC3766800.1 flagella assembly protein FlgT [Neptunicella marina]
MTNSVRIISFIFLFFSAFSHAVWFEASGQAVINGDNKQLARQQATQEAIKQALLFAGASVHSVQRMANGLLQDDKLEIRASGEVESLELINENISGDILTVSIRADIFTNKKQCRASDYSKSIASSWFSIRHRQQATAGELFNFGKTVAEQLQQNFQLYANASNISSLSRFYSSEQQSNKHNAIQLASKTDSQYVLFGTITEMDVEPVKQNVLKFWQDNPPLRNFTLALELYNGTTGEPLLIEQFHTQANWDFSMQENLSAASSRLWRSIYGKQVNSLLQDITYKVDELLSCQPAFGRVIKITDQKISVSLGSVDGVKSGDELQLFQLNQFYDIQGDEHMEYHIHPVKMIVSEVFAHSSILQPIGAVPLFNIQPNDFVMRR